MPIHHFTLIVDGPDVQEDALIEALFEAGYDDALVGRSEGIQYVEFDREATDLDDAILSAVANVEKVPGVKGRSYRRCRPGYHGRHRCTYGAYPRGGGAPGQWRARTGGFPSPVTDPRSRYRLWRWSEVQAWIGAYLGEQVESRDDDVLTAVNASLELRRLGDRLPPDRRTTLRELAGL